MEIVFEDYVMDFGDFGEKLCTVMASTQIEKSLCGWDRITARIEWIVMWSEKLNSNVDMTWLIETTSLRQRLETRLEHEQEKRIIDHHETAKWAVRGADDKEDVS